MDTYDFFQRSLDSEIRLFCRQCIVLFAGNVMFPRKRYRGLRIFYLDSGKRIESRIKKLTESGIICEDMRHISCRLLDTSWVIPLIASGFDPRKKSFTAIGDIKSLSFDELDKLLGQLSRVMCDGSAVCIEAKDSSFSADDIEIMLQKYFIQVYDIDNTALYGVKLHGTYTEVQNEF